MSAPLDSHSRNVTGVHTVLSTLTGNQASWLDDEPDNFAFLGMGSDYLLTERPDAQEPPGSISIPDTDTSIVVDAAKGKSEASRNAVEKSKAMTMPQIDGWTIAREIAGWLAGQNRQCALKQIDRHYEHQTLKDNRNVAKRYN